GFREEAGTPLGRLLWDAVRGRVRLDGLTLISHHFMSPEELATDLGKAHLAPCVCRLPVDGEMIPMCEMNDGGVRDRVYAKIATSATSAKAVRPVAEPLRAAH